VVDYVRKPIKKERLIQAFEKAKEQIVPLRKPLSNGIPTSVKPLFYGTDCLHQNFRN
jgi:two-component SAPR family response regulator